jgi:hypothetical protein
VLLLLIDGLRVNFLPLCQYARTYATNLLLHHRHFLHHLHRRRTMRQTTRRKKAATQRAYRLITGGLETDFPAMMLARVVGVLSGMAFSAGPCGNVPTAFTLGLFFFCAVIIVKRRYFNVIPLPNIIARQCKRTDPGRQGTQGRATCRKSTQPSASSVGELYHLTVTVQLGNRRTVQSQMSQRFQPNLE